MLFHKAVDELRVILAEPDVPTEVIDCAFRLIKCPKESLFMEPVTGPALRAPGAEICLKASNRLLDFLAAARARKWEEIIVAEMKHGVFSSAENALLSA